MWPWPFRDSGAVYSNRTGWKASALLPPPARGITLHPNQPREASFAGQPRSRRPDPPQCALDGGQNRRPIHRCPLALSIERRQASRNQPRPPPRTGPTLCIRLSRNPPSRSPKTGEHRHRPSLGLPIARPLNTRDSRASVRCGGMSIFVLARGIIQPGYATLAQ